MAARARIVLPSLVVGLVGAGLVTTSALMGPLAAYAPAERNPLTSVTYFDGRSGARIRELDFDHNTGKLAPNDYESMREALVHNVVELNRNLQSNTHAEEQRRAEANRSVLQDLARLQSQVAAGVAYALCDRCQMPYTAQQKFCTNCGATLKTSQPRSKSVS